MFSSAIFKELVGIFVCWYVVCVGYVGRSLLMGLTISGWPACLFPSNNIFAANRRRRVWYFDIVYFAPRRSSSSRTSFCSLLFGENYVGDLFRSLIHRSNKNAPNKQHSSFRVRPAVRTSDRVYKRYIRLNGNGQIGDCFWFTLVIENMFSCN